MLGAEERIVQLETELFTDVCRQIAAETKRQMTARAWRRSTCSRHRLKYRRGVVTLELCCTMATSSRSFRGGIR